jgi:EAL domain-containing protein (putative c-di-GMP-specific phosphodiesterase class I)
VAEGVETNEQWLRLQAVGCAEIQGFVAAKPMAASDLSERLGETPSAASRPSRARA